MERKNDDGFTLIEITLVLAIAGLVFAAIFIALSGVWADERDNERRSDMMEFIRQLKNYQTNNSRGALPVGEGRISGEDIMKARCVKNGKTGCQQPLSTYEDNTWGGFYRDYFNDSFADPDGVNYDLSIAKCNSSVPLDSSCSIATSSAYTLYVTTGAVCYGEDAVRSANARNVAVLYKMEAGGTYCENT